MSLGGELHRQRIMTKLAARQEVIRAAIDWYQCYLDGDREDELKQAVRQLLALEQARTKRKESR